MSHAFDAYVWIDPARRSGEPCIGGTRIGVEAVVGLVWGGSVELAQNTYELTRHQVLVACWYAGAYGITRLHGRDGYRPRFREPWRDRWREWAQDNAGALWTTRQRDPDAIPDPPTGDAP